VIKGPIAEDIVMLARTMRLLMTLPTVPCSQVLQQIASLVERYTDSPSARLTRPPWSSPNGPRQGSHPHAGASTLRRRPDA
jgi:hypothetical protein